MNDYRTVILHRTDGKEAEQLTMLRKDPSFKGAHLNALIKVVYRNKFLESGEQFTVCREIFKVIPVVVRSIFCNILGTKKLHYFRCTLARTSTF